MSGGYGPKSIYASGSRLITSFSDNFVRTDTARGIGSDYICQQQNIVVLDQPFMRIFGNRLRYTNATATAQTAGVSAIPRVIMNSAVWGRKQFAEIIIRATSVANDFGLFSLMITGTPLMRDFKAIFFRIDAAGQIRIFVQASNAAGAIVGATIATPAVAWAVNDTIRGEVDPGTASNRIGLIVNNVLIATVTDSQVDRPVLTGFPGLSVLNMGNGETNDYNGFSCGAGNRFI